MQLATLRYAPALHHNKFLDLSRKLRYNNYTERGRTRSTSALPDSLKKSWELELVKELDFLSARAEELGFDRATRSWDFRAKKAGSQIFDSVKAGTSPKLKKQDKPSCSLAYTKTQNGRQSKIERVGMYLHSLDCFGAKTARSSNCQLGH